MGMHACVVLGVGVSVCVYVSVSVVVVVSAHSNAVSSFVGQCG